MSGELATALAALQKDLPQVAKTETAKVQTKTGRDYSYTYANLRALSDAILPMMSALGLSFIAKPAFHEGHFVLAFSLLHASGEREDGQYPLPAGTPQEIGSAITYGRRYCLAAVTGIAPEDDDDGHLGGQAKPPRKRAAARPKTDETGELLSEKQRTMIASLMTKSGMDRPTALDYVARVIGRQVESRNELTTREASRVIDALMSDGDS